MSEVRGAGCQRGYAQPRLSTGECAIIGYVASLSMALRTPAVKNAGTIVGLLGRLEATEPRLTGFTLADPGAAQRRAIAAALVDAHDRAEAIAVATGSRLGRLVNASTGVNYGGDIVVSASRVSAPPPPAVSPITVDLAPRPIESQTTVTVTYEIAR